HTAGGRGMTPAPGATTIVPSSPASRPSPPGGLWPALTPAAGDTGMHRSGAGNKEDQQNKIHLTEVSTVSGDCQHTVVVVDKDRRRTVRHRQPTWARQAGDACQTADP